jgi:hypothetical protein
MSNSTEVLCKICNTNKCIEFSDPNAKYDICMVCYFVDVNKNRNNTPQETNKFELVKSE